VVEGAIDEDEALKNADSVNNLRLRLKLHREGGVEQTSAPAAPVAAAEVKSADWGLVSDQDEGSN
jgi:twitching motility protein PilU